METENHGIAQASEIAAGLKYSAHLLDAAAPGGLQPGLAHEPAPSARGLLHMPCPSVTRFLRLLAIAQMPMFVAWKTWAAAKDNGSALWALWPTCNRYGPLHPQRVTPAIAAPRCSIQSRLCHRCVYQLSARSLALC